MIIPTSSDRELAVDGAAIAAISVAIVSLSQRVWLMTAVVAVVVVARFVAWSVLARPQRWPLSRELALFAGCLVVGAFNDWMSVTHYRIYDYDVPTLVGWSAIPVWMLVYWGVILRFVTTLCRWHRLGPATRARRPAWVYVALLLAIVVITRQLVYRLYDHPLYSWLPFAVALVVVWFALRPTRHERIIMALFLVGGPVIEALYIQLGSLHHYHLGWLAGVPLWIALWWALSVLVWADLSGRVLQRLSTDSLGRRRTRQLHPPVGLEAGQATAARVLAQAHE